MSKILVIGYGNSLAGDDAVGFYTVKELSGSSLPHEITVKYIHQLMPEHSSEFTEYDTIIFIDAEESEIPGEIRHREIHTSDLKDTAAAAHEFTLDTILLMGYWLYGKMPEIHLITVTGSNFTTGESMSPAVQKSIPGVIDAVFSVIKRKDTVDADFTANR